ncbi:hypothetical protein B566_EDAN011899 [Ephemera danica]|nr:hypothetical protein B566_EDAN011899 [Ephemera danica]
MANAGSSQRQMCSRGVLDSSKTKSYGRSNPQHIQRKSFQESTNRKFIDFRNMTIYPESADILCSDESVYLQPNLTKEKYSDVEHYLDIQFRLLREDYIRPLRSSIAEYRQRRLLESQQQTVAAFNANHPPSEIMRNTSARIYENIKFIYEDVDESTQNSRRKKNNIMDSAFIVCFASKKDKKFKNMDWEHNQRFMLGSLLCFSSDNFKTLIFATVLERDVRVLEQGKLRITLCKEQQLISFQDRYTMVESEVFFTPYYFVLKTLQKMTEQKFPFPEYFLRLDPSDSPPSYLTMAPHCDQVRYTLLINGNSVEMRVLERATWPSAQSLRLHNAQYDALYAALTTELVIIQGPPGTGKTFIGLKIAETLVQNKFAASRTTPILVIALSNHALDQFLVGMLKFTDKIIRIGGQSRNPVLSAYNLTGKRSPTQSKEVRNLWSHVKRLETQMESLLSDIKNLESIASRGTLGPDMLDKEANHLIPMKVLEDLINGEFMSWLLKIENSHGLEILGLKYYMPFDDLLNEINKCLDCYLQRYRIKLDDRGENFTEKSRFLIQNFISYMNLELQRTRTSIQEARKRAFNLQDFEVVKHCDVVGMTTTAGARLQELLRMLNPEIGDHKQLRPKVSSYELEIDYNFSVSLFERMILTRGKCVTLTEQHRMAPQIAQLVTPSIYTTLTNAPNVITYSEIFGLEKRLFFIDHTIPEKTMEDTNSRKNEHEASFLLSLCEYLIMQGYHPSQITILSTYKGQMQHIKKVGTLSTK